MTLQESVGGGGDPLPLPLLPLPLPLPPVPLPLPLPTGLVAHPGIARATKQTIARIFILFGLKFELCQ
jgi:hypothetical protein